MTIDWTNDAVILGVIFTIAIAIVGFINRLINYFLKTTYVTKIELEEVKKELEVPINIIKNSTEEVKKDVQSTRTDVSKISTQIDMMMNRVTTNDHRTFELLQTIKGIK